MRPIVLSLIFSAGVALALAALMTVESVRHMLIERAQLEQSYDVGQGGRFGLQELAFGVLFDHPFGIGPFSGSAAVGWVICIGRVVAYDPLTQTMTFIYEPHVPTRFSSSICSMSSTTIYTRSICFSSITLNELEMKPCCCVPALLRMLLQTKHKPGLCIFLSFLRFTVDSV